MVKALVALVLLVSSPAFAMIELKAEIGALGSHAASLSSAVSKNVTDNPDFSVIASFGLDAMYIFDGIALGARYEGFAADKKTAFVTYNSSFDVTTNELETQRLSLLAGYRFIQTEKYHIGLLGHYGVSQSMEYKQRISSTNYSYKASMDPSFGGGLDVGFHFNKFMIGFELGYTQLKGKFTGTTGPLNGLGEVTADLSGGYGKFNIGMGF